MYRARHGSRSQRPAQRCGWSPSSTRSCWRRIRLPFRRRFAVDTTVEPEDSVVPTPHPGFQPGYEPAAVCPASSNDATPALASSCLWACASSSHPQSDTLSQRVLWGGLDAWAALGVGARVLPRPAVASCHENASTALPQPLLVPPELPRD